MQVYCISLDPYILHTYECVYGVMDLYRSIDFYCVYPSHEKGGEKRLTL